ncbi:Cytochrome P450 monooxygenase helB4 [Microsporum canis]
MPAALFVPRETFDALDLACGRIQVRESGYGLVALQRRPPLPPGCPPYISTKKHKLTARLDEKTDPWKGVLTAYSVACRPESSRPRFHHIRVRARIRHGKMNEDLATADHDGFKTKTVTLHTLYTTIMQVTARGLVDRLTEIVCPLPTAMLAAAIDIKALLDVVRGYGYMSTACTAVVLLLGYRLVYQLFFSPLRHIPGSIWSRLFASHSVLKRVLAQGARSVQEDYECYGDIYVLKPNGISISNPKDIKTVLTSYEFVKTDVYRMLDIKGRASIFTTRVPAQASQRRRQIGPYMNHGYLGRMEPLILQYSIVAIKKKWDAQLEEADGKTITVNFRNDTQYATFDTVGILAFGREFRALETNDPTIIRWIEATGFYLGMTKNFPLLNWYPFSRLIRKKKDAYERFVSYAEKSVEQRRAALDDGTADPKPVDLLQAFLDAEDPESERARMTPHEVSTESIAMQLAGSESTSFVVSWVLHLLTLYPEFFARAVEEVRSQFDRDHLVGFDDCNKKLPFLTACIYETLRYSPITSGFMPRVNPTNGIVIQGHYIPPGTEIAINMIGAHANKDVWDKPYLYDPTRFLDNDEAKRNVFAFSYGHRNCIGRNLAWVEMMVILANILKDYDISLPSGSVCGPHNVDEMGRPRIMPTKSTLFTTPKYPERDCLIVVGRRAEQ